MYDFSDLHFDGKASRVGHEQPIPGEVVHHYLQAFADKFDITRRIH